jgi:hypothetical protein
MNLPQGYTNVFNKFGENVPVTGESLSVKSPIYIELP